MLTSKAGSSRVRRTFSLMHCQDVLMCTYVIQHSVAAGFGRLLKYDLKASASLFSLQPDSARTGRVCNGAGMERNCNVPC